MHSKSRKIRELARRDHSLNQYEMLKFMLREVRKWIKINNEMHETLVRIITGLDESHRKSVIFWTEFMREFPEVKLDEDALKRLGVS